MVVVMSAVFLFNMLCAIVPCDPYHRPPSAPSASANEISLLGRNNKDDGTHKTFKRSGFPPDADDNPPDPFVVTESGALQGYFMKIVDGKSIYAFEGIPYSQPPTGFYRFRAPNPVKPWKGTRLALKPGSECVQIHMAKLARVLGREDCLFLNIYSPMIKSDNYSPKLPVIIFIHGGGFIFGAGHEYGPSYLLQKDVILVTINYRLGPLGFMSTGDEENPGNWGLKDQAMAIQWIADNIEGFGGDPKRITLMGQSAGGVAVHLHMMSNATKHLIQNAVSISASAFVHWGLHTRHQAGKWTEKLARLLRCPTENSKALMDCMRNRDPNFIVSNQMNLIDFLGFPPILFRPTIEPEIPGALITEFPEVLYEKGQVAKIPFLCTTTKNEAEFFVLIFKGVGIYKLLLNHWMVASPSIYDFRRVVNDTTAITNAIIKFYMEGKNPRDVSSEIFSDIGTDRYFSVGIRKALRTHSKIAPTYSYLFGFKSPIGMATSFWGQPHAEFGVPHGEDLSYFMNSTLFWPSLKREDSGFPVSQLLVTLFGNFAEKGEPMYTYENGTDVHLWHQITNATDIEFLQIDNEVKMIHDPFTKRVEFWESLNINDRYPYSSA